MGTTRQAQGGERRRQERRLMERRLGERRVCDGPRPAIERRASAERRAAGPLQGERRRQERRLAPPA